MWREIQRVIVDPTTSTGLSASFLENLSAEFIGVALGIVISFLAAFLLDKMGNDRQFKPLRHRLAQKLVGIHEELCRDLATPFSHTSDNSAPVRVALDESERIVEEFDFGLTPKQLSAVEAYRRKLVALKDYTSGLQKQTSTVNDRFNQASRVLRPALQQLHPGRMDQSWRDVLSRELTSNGGGPAPSPNPIYALFTRSNASRSDNPSQ